ncbi:MAG: hypothetical protein R3F60_26275 [bacterium]
MRFSKDSADNYYVEAARAGEVRVVFLVDADPAYFSAPLPGNVPLGAQAGQPFTELPPAIAEEGREVLAELGVAADQPFDQGLDRLVAWFRAFEAGKPPRSRAPSTVIWRWGSAACAGTGRSRS